MNISRAIVFLVPPVIIAARSGVQDMNVFTFISVQKAKRSCIIPKKNKMPYRFSISAKKPNKITCTPDNNNTADKITRGIPPTPPVIKTE